MNRIKKTLWCLVCTMSIVIITSCGSHRTVEGTSAGSSSATPGTGKITTPGTAKPDDTTISEQLQKDNVTAKLDINVNDGSNEISVDGKLQMKRNTVIRVIITPLGLMEAGRLEFTPDYVLFIDRIHKQYVKERYDEVDMLKKNGITFKKIQETFWSQYTKNRVSLSLGKTSLDINIKKISYDTKFEATSDVSAKYERVAMKDALAKITGM